MRYVSDRFRNNILAVIVVIAFLYLMTQLSGCSVTSLTRGQDGELTVRHNTFFMRSEAPSLTVDRDGVNDYEANFNAKSRGGDTAAMLQILQMFAAATAVAQPAIPTPGETP